MNHHQLNQCSAPEMQHPRHCIRRAMELQNSVKSISPLPSMSISPIMASSGRWAIVTMVSVLFAVNPFAIIGIEIPFTRGPSRRFFPGFWTLIEDVVQPTNLEDSPGWNLVLVQNEAPSAKGSVSTPLPLEASPGHLRLVTCFLSRDAIRSANSCGVSTASTH